MRKRTMILATALLAIPLTAASAAPAVRAAPSVAQFNGNWSVSIVTDSGSCDRGYRYALRIANGRIYYDNPSFSVNGQVNARGQVSVTVGAGGKAPRAPAGCRAIMAKAPGAAARRATDARAIGKPSAAETLARSTDCASGIAPKHLPRQRAGMGRVLDHDRAIDDHRGARA